MSGGGAGKVAAGPIPASARRLVQSVREIVTCPDAEIYAALLECEMDPDEAVHRLLAQDTFHEVKSKRDKKKEVKENPDTKPRATSNRGARAGAERVGRTSGFQPPNNSTENQVPKTSSILGPGHAANNQSQKQAASGLSKSIGFNGSSVPLQPSVGVQNSWSGMTGHMSMADIVKMGRPQGKPPGNLVLAGDGSYGQASLMPAMLNHNPNLSPEVDQGLLASQVPVSLVADINRGGDASDGHELYHNGWTSVAEPQPESLHIPESYDASLYPGTLESSTMLDAAGNFHESSHLDENDFAARDLVSGPSESQHAEHSENSVAFHDSLLQNTRSYQSQGHSLEENEVDGTHADISSAAVNFEHLSLENEGHASTRTVAAAPTDNTAVIIPDHLQVTNSDCAHLSFGSFASGQLSELLPSLAAKKAVEMDSVVDNSLSTDAVGDHEYYTSGPINSATNENIETIASSSTSSEKLDLPSVSESGTVKHVSLDAADLQYSLPTVSSHGYSTSTLPSMDPLQGNAQMQNLAPFASLMQGGMLNSNMLAQNVSPLRNLDISPLLTYQQQMATKYNSALPSTSGQTISMQEMVKQNVFSNTSSSTQGLPSTSVPTRPVVAQQLAAVHPYSQPTLPLAPFGNLIGYPFLPPSYAYLPSAAFQQAAYSNNGPFHQSSAAVAAAANMKYALPQYKGGVPASTLPQPSSLVSGYGGGFGSSSNIPGNISLNPGGAGNPVASLGFEESLGQQYKDAGGHYMALQQGENSQMWMPGGGSRTVPSLPANTFYNYQGQSQHGGYRQAQQPSQFGALGYPNFYQSQAAGMMPEQQQPQNPGDSGLNSGSQGATLQPSHQIWQHSY